MNKWKKHILSYIWTPFLLAQIASMFILGLTNEAGLDALMYIGWIIWVISIIFGWLPIFVFRKKGGVPKGKSFVHTTVLVDNGLYSIVRHPQYTAGILLSLALILISQNWLIAILGIVVISLLYVDIIIADRYEIEKFGDEYKCYMKNVPRANFLLGIVRLLRRRSSKNR